MAFTSGTYTDTGNLMANLGAWLGTLGWTVVLSTNNGQSGSKFCFQLGSRYWNFWTRVNDGYHNVYNAPGEGDYIMGKISLAYSGVLEPWEQVPNFVYETGGGAYNSENLHASMIGEAGRSGNYRFYYNDGEVAVVITTNLGLYRHFSFGEAQVLDPYIVGGIGYLTANAIYAATEHAANHPYSVYGFSASPYMYAPAQIQANFGTARDWAASGSTYNINQWTVTDGRPWSSSSQNVTYPNDSLEFGLCSNGYNSYGLVSYISPVRIYIIDAVTTRVHLIGHIKNYCAMNVRYPVAGSTFTIGPDTWRTYPLIKKQQTETILAYTDYNSFWTGVGVREA